MASMPARTTPALVGAVLALVGLVFAGQGLGLIPGSSMTGDRKWFYIGLVMAVVGVVLIILAVRRSRTPRA
jgi:uncharacterized membrane protein YidH (DUF202 family)